MDGPKSDKLLDAACVAAALFFPCSLLLLVYPADIFVNNLAEYAGDLATIWPLLVAGIALGGVSLVVGCVLVLADVQTRWTVASTAVSLGIYLVISDLVAPVSVDVHIGFNGSESVLQPSGTQIVLDIAAGLILTALFFRFRGPAFTKILTTFAMVFLALNIGGDLRTFRSAQGEAENDATSNDQWQVKSPPPAVAADHPNIYHVILDGFQGMALRPAMELAGLTPGDLDGFIYFPKNRSNYDGTQMSFPSFMSGTIYQSGSLQAWMSAWYTSGMWNMIKDVQATNLQVYANHGGYGQTPFDMHRKMASADTSTLRASVTTLEPFGQRRINHFTDIIFHLSLAKIVPSFWQQYVFRDGSGLFSGETEPAMGEADPRLQPFRLLVSDESSRPAHGQSVFVHVFVPHAPYLLDAQCGLHGEDTRYAPDEPYIRQAACALQFVRELLDELRRLDRYDESAILIHSDHGWPLGEPVEPLTDSAAEARISEVDLTEQDPRNAWHLDTFTAALLLVKPPGASSAPMATSQRSTQLLDIPGTVFDMLDLDLQTPEGMSVLSDDYPESVGRHIYPGFRRWDRELDKQVWVGGEVLEGDLNHFVWTSGQGWAVLPNLPFSWE